MKRLQIVVTFLALLIVISFGLNSNTYAFEGGEHKWLGDQAYADVIQSLIDNGLITEDSVLWQERMIPITVSGGVYEYTTSGGAIQQTVFPDIAVSYGDLVALGGDFFYNPSDVVNNESNDLSALIGYFNQEIIGATEENKIGDAYDVSNTHLWWNSEYFIDIVLHNESHFVGHNLITYVRLHQTALGKARESCQTNDPELFNQALIDNSFADHFLSDMFSSGHMRVPRLEVLELFQTVYGGLVVPRPQDAIDGSAGITAKILHDYDNEFSLSVENSGENTPWNAYGDKYFFHPNNESGRTQAIKAVSYSIQEVLIAAINCVETDTLPSIENFRALSLIPVVESGYTGIEEIFNICELDFAKRASYLEEQRGAMTRLTDTDLDDVNLMIRSLPSLVYRFQQWWKLGPDDEIWSHIPRSLTDRVTNLTQISHDDVINYDVAAIIEILNDPNSSPNPSGEIQEIIRRDPQVLAALPEDVRQVLAAWIPLEELRIQYNVEFGTLPYNNPCSSSETLVTNNDEDTFEFIFPLDCLASCDLFAWSPDGQYLSLVTSHDADIPTTSLYNLSNSSTAFQTITALPSFQEFSPDGTQLLMSDHKGAVLRDVTSGAVVREFPGNDEDCGFAGTDLSQDGRLVASNQGNTTRIWNVNTGELLNEIVTGTASCSPFSYSARWGRAMLTPSGDRLVTWTPGADIPFQVWDTSTGSLLSTIQDATGFNAVDAILSPNRTQLAVATRGPILLFDLATGDLLATLSPPEGQFWAMAYNPDGTMLATGGTYHYIFTTPRDTGHTITLWDTSTGDVISEIDAHSEAITDLAFSPDGQTLASASNDHSIKLWNTVSGNAVSTIQLPFEAPVDPLGEPASSITVKFSPDGRYLLSISREDTGLNDQIVARLWSVSDLPQPSSNEAATELNPMVTPTSTPEITVPAEEPSIELSSTLEIGSWSDWIIDVVWSPDVSKFATVDTQYFVKLWDANTNSEYLQIEVPATSGSVSIAWSPDSTKIATTFSSTGGTEPSITIWDATSGELIQTWTIGGGGARSIAWSPDGNKLLMAGNEITVWNLSTETILLILNDSNFNLSLNLSARWSPDGSKIVTSHNRGTSIIWNAMTGEPLYELTGHDDLVIVAEWSPDGSRIATASHDHTARIWDATNGQQLVVLEGHSREVYDVAWSPDGQFVATSGNDETMRIWNAASGEPVLVEGAHAGSVTSMSWSSIGRHIITGGGDGLVNIWDVNFGGSNIVQQAASPSIDTTVVTPSATPNESSSPVSHVDDTDTSLETLGNELATVVSNSDWSPIEQDFDAVSMVLVPPGCFNMGGDSQAQMWEFGNWTMGVSDGGTQCFAEPFWIDKFEVTQAQFNVFGGQRTGNNYYEGDNRPIESLTWFEARDFCLLRGSRLPSEGEWEYAARGPSNLIYPWGNSFVSTNAVWQTGFRGTADVGSITGGASWVGALDMSGNVWEWTNSLYAPYPYDVSDGRESDDVSGNTPRVVRGGSWPDTFDVYLRSTTRGGSNPSLSEWFNGFRCVRSYESVLSESEGDISATANSVVNSTLIATTAIPVSTPVLTAEPTTTNSTSTTPDCIATVTGVQTLNVRQGPGTQFAVVAQVSSGSQHDVVSSNEDHSWIQIQYENTPEAWISSQYATVSCEATTNDADEANSSVEYGETIFADSFDDNQYDWELANGSGGVTDFFSDGGFTMQINVSQNWEYWVTAPGFSDWRKAPIFTDPYEIEFTVDVNAPNGGYGIVVLFDVQQNYEPYKRLIINSDGTWQLIRWSGVREVLAQGSVSNNININDGNIHTIALRVEIDQYVLLVDGQEVAVMPSFDPINGTIGFGVSRGNAQVGDTLTARFHEIDIRSVMSE